MVLALRRGILYSIGGHDDSLNLLLYNALRNNHEKRNDIKLPMNEEVSQPDRTFAALGKLGSTC